MLDRHCDGRIPHEREPACQHLIHDDTGRVKVASGVDLGALGLFRRDIVDGAYGLLRHGVLTGDEPGDAEIRHLHGPVLQDHDVMRLDITVNDAP